MRKTIAALAALAFPILGAGIAHANPVVVGPGTSIGLCTITTAGHLADGTPVALTAGHCRSITNVSAIGHYSSWGISTGPAQDDWALITLNPDVQITDVAPNGQVLDHFGPAPSVGSSITKYGETTKTTTGTVCSINSEAIETTAPLFDGDSGGPAYQGSGIVGFVDGTNISTPFSPFWYETVPALGITVGS